MVSASEAVCASILPRRILYIHTAPASEINNIPPEISNLKGGKMEIPVDILP